MDSKGNFRIDKQATLSPWEFYAQNKKEFKSYNLFEEEDIEEENEATQKKIESRPITPINDAIKKPPSDHTELAKCFRSRLHLDNVQSFVSPEDQNALADVLTTAIVSVWPAHRRQGPDPFLNDNGNKELQRRVAVYVVDTVEKLFAKYIDKAKEMNELKIFSSEANMSRLKTQLLHEANNMLDILRVRRKLAEEMRQVPENDWFPNQPIGSDLVSMFSSIKRIDEVQTKILREKSYRQFIQKQLSELKHQMDEETDIKRRWHPSTDFIESLKKIEKKLIYEEKSFNEEKEDIEVKTTTSSSAEMVAKTTNKKIIHRCPSMPELTPNFEDFEELINCREFKKRPSITQLCYEDNEKLHSENTKVSLRDDVENLARISKETLESDDTTEDDVSPLLQSNLHYKKKQQHRLINIDILMKKNIDASQMNITAESSSYSTIKSEISSETSTFTETSNEDGDESVPQYQPDVLNVKIPKFGIVQISDAQICNEIKDTEMSLQKFPVTYNELLGEISDEEARNLDRHLFIGNEIKEVYDEITNVLSQEHMQFDKDDYVENCAAEDFQPMGELFSSGMMNENPEQLTNRMLRRETVPPWYDYETPDDWRNEPKFSGIGREDILKMNSAMSTGKVSTNQLSSLLNNDNQTQDQSSNIKVAKSYTAWLTWYKNNLNTDDYKKYISKKNTDFLGEIFHMYESDDENENENERIKRKTTAELEALREMQRKKDELFQIKTKFEPGFWNVRCVAMGGLGKDPNMTDNELVLEEKETEDATKSTQEASPYVMLQDRIERIWDMLKLSDQRRFDMAMKYSSKKSHEDMIQMVELMENAAILIHERESYVAKLEAFEKHASDPNRFFVKGSVGSSLARINEEKVRGKLHKSIKIIEKDLTPILEYISEHHGTNLMYQDREYLNKMQSDCIEMLYWLQQERRQNAMQNISEKNNNVLINLQSLDYLDPSKDTNT